MPGEMRCEPQPELRKMTRLQALEAVAEAARVLAHRVEHGMSLLNARCKVQATLAALDAIPAQPAGQAVGMVEQALFGTARGARCLADPSSGFASKLIMDGWRRLGTVTLEVTP